MTSDLKNDHRARRWTLIPLITLSLALATPFHDWIGGRSVAWAEVNLTTPNGVQLTIDDEGQGGVSASTTLNDWPLLCVQAPCEGAACAPCVLDEIYHAQGSTSALELGGRQRALTTQNLEGIDVTRKIYVPVSGPAEADGFFRVTDSFYNPGTQPRSISIRLGSLDQPDSTIGSESAQIWRTSSYDASLTTDDRWLLIDDQDAQGGAPNVVVIFQGSGGTSPQTISYDESSRQLSWRYEQITVPARQTVNVVTLIQLEASRVSALAEARSLLRFRTVDATFGMSTLDRRAIHNVDVDPDNASPLADLNGPYSGNEGQAIQLSAASSFDQEGSDLIYRWDIDGDQIYGEPGLESSGANLLVTYAQDGDYPVALEVEDAGGKIDRDRVIVNVRNVRPVLSSLLTNSPIGEGGTLEVLMEGADVGAEDVISYAIDWEGTGDFVPVNSPAEHRYLQDGVYEARVKLTDGDGGETVSHFTVRVNNLAPTIRQVTANNPSSEGAETLFEVLGYDPGQDPLTFRFDFDQDGFFDVTNATGSASYVYPEDGSYTVVIEVRDDRGDLVRTNYPISVRNVAPTIDEITVSERPAEGAVTIFNISASDVGQFDLLTYEFDLDGQAGFEISQSSPLLRHTFPDNGRYAIQVRVVDDESAVASRQIEVDVANVPPTGGLRFEGANVREGIVATGDQGRSFEVVATGADQSAIDASSLSYNWDLNGDGIYEFLSSDARQTLRFDQEGEYLIRCLIRDKDRGEVIIEREVLIAGRPPELVGFTIESEAPYLEGTPIRFNVEAIDTDEITYAFDFDGDGGFDLIGGEPNVRWSFPNEGTYEVTVRVSDDSGYIESSLTVDVLNAPPTVELNTGVNVGEGEELNIEVTARDPGVADTVTVTVQFQGQTEIVELSPDQSTRFSITTQDDGFIDITASAVDDAGAASIEYSARAFIENRPPFIPPFSPTPALEGQQYSQVIPADDPAGLNDALFFSLIEPPANVEIEPFSGLLLWSPSYEDYLNSPISFELLIEDEDGGRLERTVTIEVRPRDEDQDGIPDTYEELTCERFSPCLSPNDPDDAQQDSDGDGRANLDEWSEGSEPFIFEGPETPTQLSPVQDEVVSTLPIELVVSHVESDRPLPLNEDGSLAPRDIVFEYEIYADEQGASLVESSGPQPMRSIDERETNRWSANAEDLIEDQLYWWRVRAVDGPAVSAWSELYSFRVNAENRPPEAPTLALPLDQSIVADLTPALTFNPSTDPDGESVYFVVRVYRESPDGLVVDFGGQVEVGEGGPLVFEPNNRLQENARYQWDVVAIDEVGLESAPSERWSFVVDLENEPPSEPLFISPERGETVTRLRPLFQAGGSVDQEGAEVSYHFEVRVVGEMIPIAATAIGGVTANAGVAEWVPEVDLKEDREHVASLYASDGVTQTGVVTAQFYVSSEDNAPPVPELLDPSDNALVAPRDAVLIWTEVQDPERGNVRYQVEYCTPEGACQESEILSNNSFSLEGLIPSQVVYTWRARSLDDAGNSLGYSAARYLTLSASNGAAQRDEGGCAQLTPESHLPLWGLLLLSLIATLRARTRLKHTQ